MISIEDLGNRDNWICHLCGQPVKREGKRNKVWSATRDHVLPKSLGGKDSADNLKLAHRKCNTLRANQPVTKFRKKAGFKQDWKEEMHKRREHREAIFNRIRGVA